MYWVKIATVQMFIWMCQRCYDTCNVLTKPFPSDSGTVFLIKWVHLVATVFPVFLSVLQLGIKSDQYISVCTLQNNLLTSTNAETNIWISVYKTSTCNWIVSFADNYQFVSEAV